MTEEERLGQFQVLRHIKRILDENKKFDDKDLKFLIKHYDFEEFFEESKE